MDEAIARARMGDREALGALYARYAPIVGSYIASRLHAPDRSQVDDLTQAVFVDVVQRIHRYEDRGWPFTAWSHR